MKYYYDIKSQQVGIMSRAGKVAFDVSGEDEDQDLVYSITPVDVVPIFISLLDFVRALVSATPAERLELRQARRAYKEQKRDARHKRRIERIEARIKLKQARNV